MAFDVKAARKEGYSDAEIAAHLAQVRKFDVAGARKEGYSDAEIVAHLAGTPAKPSGLEVPIAGGGQPSAVAAQRDTPTALGKAGKAYRAIAGERTGLEPDTLAKVRRYAGIYTPLVDVPVAALDAIGGAAGAAAFGAGQFLENNRVIEPGTADRLGRDLLGGFNLAQIVAGGPRAGPPLAPVRVSTPSVPLPSLTRGTSVQRAAAKVLRGEASNPDAAYGAVERALRNKPVSGATPTLAEITRDPGIAGLQRSLGDTSIRSGARINEVIDRNAVLRANVLDRVEPSANPAIVGEALRNQQSAASRRVQDAVSAFGEGVQPADDLGARVRAALDTNLKAARARTSAAYRRGDLDEAGDLIELRPRAAEDVLPAPSIDPVRAGLSQEATNLRDAVAAAGRDVRATQGERLLQFVRNAGGVRLDDVLAGDVRQTLGGKLTQSPGLLRKSGRGIDELAEIAAERGYIKNRDTQEFLDALESDVNAGSGGDFVFPIYGESNQAQRAIDARRLQDQFTEQFDRVGFDPAKATHDDYVRLLSEVRGIEPAVVTLEDTLRVPQLGKPQGELGGLASAIRARYFDDGAFAPAPAIRKLFEDVEGADVATLKQLENFARRADALAGEAPNPTQRAAVQSLGKGINAFLDIQAPPYRRAALREAAAARRAQGEVFERGAVGSVLDRPQGSFGNFALNDAQVPAKLFKPGVDGGVAIKQYIAASDRPSAISLARAELRNAIGDAVPTRADVQRLTVRYREALRELPELKDDIEKLAARTAFSERLASNPIYRAFANPDADVTAQVGKFFGASDRFSGLRGLQKAVSGDRDAQAGLRRALAETVIGRSRGTKQLPDGTRVPSSAALYKEVSRLTEADKAVPGLFTGPQRQLLTELQKEIDGQQFALTANRTAGSSTARNGGLGAKLVSYATRAAEIKSGLPVGNVLQIIKQSLNNVADVHDLVASAMVDPKLAAELLKPATQNRLRSVGITIDGRASAMIGASARALSGAAANNQSPFGNVAISIDAFGPKRAAAQEEEQGE